MKRIILILTLGLISGCSPSEAHPPQPESAKAFSIDKSKGVISMDSRVPPPQKRRFDIGQGSVTLETVSTQAGRLTFRYTPEVEGGYTVYECEVPVSSTPVTVQINPDGTPGATSFDLSKCKTIRSGSLLDDQARAAPNAAEADPFFAHLEAPAPQEANVQGAVFDADPENAKIASFVDYLDSNAIQLRYHRPTRRWRVESPRLGDYLVEIENLGAFPDAATVAEMKAGCGAINLAHGLNLQAQLIMSLPGLTREPVDPQETITAEESVKRAAEIRSSDEFIALQSKLKQLFVEYVP